jgi:hypothetical protein
MVVSMLRFSRRRDSELSREKSRELRTRLNARGLPSAEADQELREFALFVGHGVLMVLVLAIWVVAGWVVSSVSSHTAFEVTLAVGTGVIAGLFAGAALHLVRYFVALMARRRERGARRVRDARASRWPRVSADRDFLLEGAVALIVFLYGVLS